MAFESLALCGDAMVASFGSRALSFYVDSDEVENLREHIEVLADASAAVLRVIEAYPSSRSVLPEKEIEDAITGASFLAQMATQLRRHLKRHSAQELRAAQPTHDELLKELADRIEADVGRVKPRSRRSSKKRRAA